MEMRREKKKEEEDLLDIRHKLMKITSGEKTRQKLKKMLNGVKKMLKWVNHKKLSHESFKIHLLLS